MAEIVDHFGTPPGYLGPISMQKPVKVIADRTVAEMADFVCGANQPGFHLTGVNWRRDLPEPDLVADIRTVVAGDDSPDGKGKLVGDVDTAAAAKVAGAITPVPGGVGPMTIACLLKNTVAAAQMQKGLPVTV